MSTLKMNKPDNTDKKAEQLVNSKILIASI